MRSGQGLRLAIGDDSPGSGVRIRWQPHPRAVAILLVVVVAVAVASGLAHSVQPRQSTSPSPAATDVAPSRAATTPASSAPTPAGVVVHVVGSVARPGIVKLPGGARVLEAIEAAGGVVADADVAAVNLARVVEDGEQLVVPRQGETLRETEASAASAASGSADGAGRVKVNSANESQLTELPGIGPALAARIVDYRREHGPFSRIEDLADVPGIGVKTLEKFRDKVALR